MNTVLITSLCGLITAFCWGTSDYLSARSTRKLNSFQINFASQLTGIVVVAIVLAVSGIHINTATEWLRIIASSALISIAFVIFVQALSGGVVGIIVPLGNIYPLFTIILSILFLNAHFSFLQLSAMFIILLGAGLLAYEKNHKKVPLHVLHRKTILSITAAVIWGLAFFLVSPVTHTVSWQSISIVSELFALPFSIVLLAVTSRQQMVMDIKKVFTSKPALLAGIVGESGLMVFYLGSGRAGGVVIPAVLASCAPLVASLYGGLFDHERIGHLKRIGAVVVVAGIVILNIA